MSYRSKSRKPLLPDHRNCAAFLVFGLAVAGIAATAGCRSEPAEAPQPTIGIDPFSPDRGDGGPPETARPRVVVLGFDGTDPRLLQQWMDEGLLPNLKNLAESGYFAPLRSTTPPQSPVAWATFASGHHPGEHGIYDFIHRNPRNYLPQVATVRVDRPVVQDGRVVRGLEGENLRRGSSFWNRAGQAGVKGSVLFIPYSYPPDGTGGMRVISGLGTPDVRGTNSTFHYVAVDGFPGGREAGPVSGGAFVRADHEGEGDPGYGAALTGPTVDRDGRRDPVALATRLAVENGRLTARHGDHEVSADRGTWSDPMPFTFEIADGVTWRALSRWYPVPGRDDPLAAYLAPLSADPRDPPFDISTPPGFAKELADAIGRPFKTVGWAHEMNGLSAEALDDAGFLADMFDTMKAREEILLHILKEGHDELTVAAFTATDRVAHMFWRLFDETHPRYDAELAAKHGHAIRDTYVRMDEIVGRVLEAIDDDTILFIMSDHGFHGYNRGLNLNRWLVNEGYMVLREGATVGGDFFRDVDWSRTRAYGLGTGQLWLNVAGRERDGIVPASEADALAAEISGKLTGLRDGETVAVTRVQTRAELYSGATAEIAPDLTVSFSSGYRTAWPSILGAAPPDLWEDNDRKWSGDHAATDAAITPGILLSNRKLAVEDPGIEDVAATILSLYGVRHDLPGQRWDPSAAPGVAADAGVADGGRPDADAGVADDADAPGDARPCDIDVSALIPLLQTTADGAVPVVTREAYRLVETVALDDVTLVVRQGGCTHYEAVFVFFPVPEAGESVALARAYLSKAPLQAAPGGGAGRVLLERLAAAAASEDDFIDCGDATCTVERGPHAGDPAALIIRYDLAL
jgi:predicted AlkP superfamily phosphohydrolase/phosphomutase